MVRLGQPVLRIASAGGRVTTSTPTAEFTSRRVIVSVPPGLAGRIDYEPALPTVRDQLTQRAPMGSVIKCQVLYDEPFWRADGLSGQALGDGEGSRVVFDNSPPEGSPGMLLAFVEGDEARRLGRASAAVRREAVLGSLTRYFGRRAASPADYFELDWQQERWSGGCYGTLFGPNVWTRYGAALREPAGLIHWAGTETATAWCGYMDGAVRSGERAAAEVRTALSEPAKLPSTAPPERPPAPRACPGSLTAPRCARAPWSPPAPVTRSGPAGAWLDRAHCPAVMAALVIMRTFQS